MNNYSRRVAGLLMGLILMALLVACGNDATPTPNSTGSGAAAAVTATVAGSTTGNQATAGNSSAGGSAVLGTDGKPVTFSAGANPPALANPTPTKLPDGLQYIDLKVGDGAPAQAKRSVRVKYTGWLAASGKKFDSSEDHDPSGFKFELGVGSVIQGWDEGVAGMKVGGLRRLIIPSALGYGPAAVGGVIPANSDLIFDVQLLEAN